MFVVFVSCFYHLEILLCNEKINARLRRDDIRSVEGPAFRAGKGGVCCGSTISIILCAEVFLLSIEWLAGTTDRLYVASSKNKND